MYGAKGLLQRRDIPNLGSSYTNRRDDGNSGILEMIRVLHIGAGVEVADGNQMEVFGSSTLKAFLEET